MRPWPAPSTAASGARPSRPGTGSAPAPRTRRAPGGRRRARPRRRGPCTPTSRPPSLLEAALDRMDEDPEASDADRYRVLMSLADAHRWRGAWLLAGAHGAPTPSRSPADRGRAAAGARPPRASPSARCGRRGVRRDNPQVVAALEDVAAPAARRGRRAALPGDDGAGDRALLRSAVGGRAALAEDAVAMARRIGDEQLLVDACEVGFAAIWSPANGARRLALATEAMERAPSGSGPTAASSRRPRCARSPRASSAWSGDGGLGRDRAARRDRPPAPRLPAPGRRVPAAVVARDAGSVRGGGERPGPDGGARRAGLDPQRGLRDGRCARSRSGCGRTGSGR